MCVKEKRKEEKYLRREEKERKGHWCFSHKGKKKKKKKKKRDVCYEMKDSSLFTRVFYRRFY